MYMNPTNNQQAMGLQVFYNEDTNVNIRIVENIKSLDPLL